MKMLVRILLVILLLAAGFAAGFPVGRSSGFATGTEWAIMQAELVARKAGLTMPVDFEDGSFRVVLRQPPHLYRRAWRLADKYEEKRRNNPMAVAQLSP